jgi:hypothetical protein
MGPGLAILLLFFMSEIGFSVVKMQHLLLQVPEQVSSLVTKDFIGVIITLLSIEENEIILQCLKVCLSSRKITV